MLPLVEAILKLISLAPVEPLGTAIRNHKLLITHSLRTPYLKTHSFRTYNSSILNSEACELQCS
jgi:hypothetical protein